MGVAMAALVNIQSGNPGEKLQRGSFCGFPGYYGSKQGSVWSLRSSHWVEPPGSQKALKRPLLWSGQRKMDVTKSVKTQTKIDVDESPTSQTTATEDYSNLTETALASVNRAVTDAVKAVEEAENPIKNITWITHSEFTEERGREQIEEFILTWEHQDNWLHYTELIERKDLIHSFHYIYCVRWSIPTASRPVTQVSAAAFFTIKVFKSKPDIPIEVSYIFEDHSLVHRPGMTCFQGKWPKDITESKNTLMESIDF
ncbi:A-kinase anchor protein 14-like isoform X1 [Manis pentadactyla]|uniref:A-kinase anchor protein 14 isoform X1 n=2 Tax=Manis pentadactyla TaxID=143292 RepID=UPI00255C744C|nr:A-kinase anchor protein 14 isoform X1 [Manis pentadactyla]XP_057351828.1 A-kinase anchor protein 14-like isoform X1 [Manis pentadactyla]XP_057351834.1 A-kinase anchor protein 14-like isoform X1 [Manis pentadactyla]